MREDEANRAAGAFEKLYGIIARLRGPGGCPWDIEQTPFSLRSDLIEETYECVEAIDEGDPGHIKEELGDIFQAAALIAYICEQEGLFSVAEALETVSEKLVRRHPHVFGADGTSSGGANPGGVLSSEQVLKNWAKIKVEREGRRPKDSVLDEISRGLPPLDRAWKLQKKAAKAGFDWPDAAGAIAKIKEELKEVEEAALANASAEAPAPPPAGGKPAPERAAWLSPSAAALEGELGDLLFSAVNLCRFFEVEPSVALQRTNAKFAERFKYVEKRMKESGREMNSQNLSAMDGFWDEAKRGAP